MKFSFFRSDSFICCCLFFSSILLASCDTSVTAAATGSDGAAVKFSGGFSKEAADCLKDLMIAAGGLSGDVSEAAEVQFFSSEEIKGFLTGAGVQAVKANATKDNQVSAAGTIESVSKNRISKTGLLTRTSSSLKLTLGPDQISSIYENLDEESQGYFDLMMIPALTGETMTASEYGELLSGVYGPVLAKEILKGKMKILLLSPDGKKSTAASITLGELFTLTQSKSWSVSW